MEPFVLESFDSSRYFVMRAEPVALPPFPSSAAGIRVRFSAATPIRAARLHLISANGEVENIWTPDTRRLGLTEFAGREETICGLLMTTRGDTVATDLD